MRAVARRGLSGAPPSPRRERYAAIRPVSTDEGRDVVARAVVAAKAGEGDALRYLYVRYADDVHRYMCTIVYEAHEAEDITRQVFTKLPSALSDYEQGEVPFAAWVLRFAHGVALDHLRSLRVVPREGARGSAPDADHFEGDRLRALGEAPTWPD